MPAKSYRHICKEKNFLYLNSKNVLQPKLLETITDFINKSNDKGFKADFKTTYLVTRIFPNAYIPMCFPKSTAPPKNKGSISKVIFTSASKKLESSLGKNPENYEQYAMRQTYTIKNL